jgi:hypothetical protein
MRCRNGYRKTQIVQKEENNAGLKINMKKTMVFDKKVIDKK